MKTRNSLKTAYLRRIISSKGYTVSRADTMNDRIQHWKETKQHTNTVKGRQFCEEMIQMYLKRYTFYINERLANLVADKPRNYESGEAHTESL